MDFFLHRPLGMVQKSSRQISVNLIGWLKIQEKKKIFSFSLFRKQKREATDRGGHFEEFLNEPMRIISLGRREALDKSQRTDGESTVTGSSTPSAGSSSSLSSVGQEVSSNNDHSSQHLAVCPTALVSTASCHSNSSSSDSSSMNQSAQSPSFCQQPLALTTSNTRVGSNNNNNNFNHHSRKETFPINHLRQQQQPMTSPNTNSSNGPFLKLWIRNDAHFLSFSSCFRCYRCVCVCVSCTLRVCVKYLYWRASLFSSFCPWTVTSVFFVFFFFFLLAIKSLRKQQDNHRALQMRFLSTQRWSLILLGSRRMPRSNLFPLCHLLRPLIMFASDSNSRKRKSLLSGSMLLSMSVGTKVWERHSTFSTSIHWKRSIRLHYGMKWSDGLIESIWENQAWICS